MNHCHNDKGQALIESLVLLLVLLPLLWMVDRIGSLGHLAHQTEQASRYTAQQFVVQAEDISPESLRDQWNWQLPERWFGPAGAPIRSVATSSAYPGGHPLWTDPVGRPLLGTPPVRIGHGPSQSPLPDQASALPASDGRPFALDPFQYSTATRLQLPVTGIRQVHLEVPLAPPPVKAPSRLDAIDWNGLSIHRQAAWLPHDWSATSPTQAQQRSAQLTDPGRVWSQSMQGLVSLVTPWVELAPVKAPALFALEQWEDAVPSDRLHPIRTAP